MFFAGQCGVSSWHIVTDSLVEKYVAHLETQEYAPRSQYLEVTTIKQIQKWLLEKGRLPNSVPLKVSAAKPHGSNNHCWSKDEVDAMIDRCNSRRELFWLENVIKFLACTGLRISELVSLRWSDLDLVHQQLTIADETGSVRPNSAKARTTKSGKSRIFPIHSELLAAIATMPMHQDGYVFHGPKGGKLKPDLARRALIRDVLTPLEKRFPSKDGANGFRDGRLHSFRHYFCSECANAGVPQQMLMLWLGHSDSEMVRHYYHLHDTAARVQMERINFVGNSAVGNVASGESGKVSSEGAKRKRVAKCVQTELTS